MDRSRFRCGTLIRRASHTPSTYARPDAARRGRWPRPGDGLLSANHSRIAAPWVTARYGAAAWAVRDKPTNGKSEAATACSSGVRSFSSTPRQAQFPTPANTFPSYSTANCSNTCILAPGGTLILTKPNIVSLRAAAVLWEGRHPGWFTPYCWPPATRSPITGTGANTPRPRLCSCSVMRDSPWKRSKQAPTVLPKNTPSAQRVAELLGKDDDLAGLRGDCTYAVARKSGPVENRFPSWLYQRTS